MSRSDRKPPEAQATLPPANPLKPRPRLFIALLVLFFVWVGCLLAMYFKTVYPQRHGASTSVRQ